MAGYVLYVPKVQACNPDHLRRVGLDFLADEPGLEFADVLRGGPDGGAGVVCTWRRGQPDSDPHLSVKSCQEWTPCKADADRELAAGRWWLGIEPDRPVRPRDLEKRATRPGYLVKLNDGQQWHIPAAIRLPHRIGLDENGRFARTVKEPYAAFYKKADEYALKVFGELDAIDALALARPDIDTSKTVVRVELDDAWHFACEALAVNYRLTPEIIDLLDLLDDAAMISVIMAVVDLPEINMVREEKKTYQYAEIPVG